MTQKKHSFQHRLSTRRSSTFVGREQEIELFKQNLLRLPDDDQYYFIFNIHGQGGVGKTTLVQKFQTIAKENEYLTIYTDESIEGPLEFMEEVAKQLNNQDAALKTFGERFKKYQEEKEKLEKSIDAPSGGLISLIARTGTNVGIHAVKSIPGAGAFMEIVDNEAIAKQAQDWMDYIYKRVTNKDERQLILKPEEVLTPLLLNDLYKICKDRRIGWFIDTFEDVSRSLDSWLRSLLEGRYGEVHENILFVIAGREELDPNNWLSFHPVARKFSIEHFTKEEAIQFLNQRQITNEQVVDELLEISMRLPVLLAMLADIAPTGSEVKSDLTGTAVKRFLKWINDPIQKRIALHSALPRQLNQDILSALLNKEEDVEHYFNWLKNRPFVQKRGQYWTYHKVVRDLMLQYQFELSQKKWSKLNEKMATYFNDMLIHWNHKDEKDKWFDENWVKIKLEAIYHELNSNFRDALPSAIKSLVQILRLRKSQDTLPWIFTIQQSCGLWNEHDWGEILVNGIAGISAKNWSSSQPMFTKINELNCLDGEDAAYCFFAEGWIWFQLKQINKSLHFYKKATELKPDYAKAYNNIGNVHYKLKNTDEAIEAYQMAIKVSPNYASAYHNLGNIYSDIGEIDKAIEFMEKALELKPEERNTYNSLGWVNLQIRLYKKAKKYLKKARKFANGDGYPEQNLGHLYMLLNNYEKAIKWYKKSLSFWDNQDEFFHGMITDYNDLQMASNGIETERYNLIIDQLKNFTIE